jgi:hypothetical protein
MNEILQKRIEEAAYQYIQSDAVAPENMQLAFGDFINGAKCAMQNQWISTSESMPPLDEVSFNGSIGVIARTSEGVVRYAYYHHYLKQWFSVETSTRIDNVTKWMFVPEEGGEK